MSTPDSFPQFPSLPRDIRAWIWLLRLEHILATRDRPALACFVRVGKEQRDLCKKREMDIERDLDIFDFIVEKKWNADLIRRDIMSNVSKAVLPGQVHIFQAVRRAGNTTFFSLLIAKFLYRQKRVLYLAPHRACRRMIATIENNLQSMDHTLPYTTADRVFVGNGGVLEAQICKPEKGIGSYDLIISDRNVSNPSTIPSAAVIALAKPSGIVVFLCQNAHLIHSISDTWIGEANSSCDREVFVSSPFQ